MTNFWYIKDDFLKDRQRRIGASDIPKIIPNPEKPSESLAGYEQTPLTVWEEKTGRKERDPAGLPAEMGHYMENKALELFIRDKIGYEQGVLFRQQKETYEHLQARKLSPDPEQYQYDDGLHKLYHNTQYYRDSFIAHPDMIWIPPDDYEHGPAIVEAKSATYWSAKRRGIVDGYDFELTSWQGIPLKHYMQIQFQMVLFGVDVAYLSLVYDTSKHQVWKIEANKDHQAQIIDIAGRLAWHIENDIPPKEMVINQEDIKSLYPVIADDFTMLSGDEKEQAVKWAKAGKEAAGKVKTWTEKKKEAEDALAVLLKDMGEIRDSSGCIAKWQLRSGYERILSLSEIKKREGGLKNYRYLKRNGLLVPPGEPSRSVKIMLKE